MPSRILMCPPDHYGIEYEINPWMSRSRGSDTSRAAQQWNALYESLRGLGVTIELMTPQSGLPDLVFTANAGLVFRTRFFSSSFRHEVRARETPHFDAWFAGHGFMVEHLPEGMYFEGAGDALFCGPILFAGYRIRSDALAHQHLGHVLGKMVLPLELVNPRFYHLDTCFCPLNDRTVLFAPAAFDSASQQLVRRLVPHVIEVPVEVAAGFACNAISIGDRVISSLAAERLEEPLHDAGFDTLALPMSEFLKSGGGVRCLSLPLDLAGLDRAA
jgi:arginine dihydrolase